MEKKRIFLIKHNKSSSYATKKTKEVRVLLMGLIDNFEPYKYDNLVSSFTKELWEHYYSVFGKSKDEKKKLFDNFISKYVDTLEFVYVPTLYKHCSLTTQRVMKAIKQLHKTLR